MARRFESLISNAKIEFTDQILTELLTKQTTKYDFLNSVIAFKYLILPR